VFRFSGPSISGLLTATKLLNCLTSTDVDHANPSPNLRSPLHWLGIAQLCAPQPRFCPAPWPRRHFTTYTQQLHPPPSVQHPDLACHVSNRFGQKPCHVLNVCHVFNTLKRDTVNVKTGHTLLKHSKLGENFSNSTKQVHSLTPPCHETNRFT